MSERFDIFAWMRALDQADPGDKPRALATRLFVLADSKTGELPAASIEALAAKTNLPPRTLRRALRPLKQAGLIVHKRGHRFELKRPEVATSEARNGQKWPLQESAKRPEVATSDPKRPEVATSQKAETARSGHLKRPEVATSAHIIGTPAYSASFSALSNTPPTPAGEPEPSTDEEEGSGVDKAEDTWVSEAWAKIPPGEIPPARYRMTAEELAASFTDTFRRIYDPAHAEVRYYAERVERDQLEACLDVVEAKSTSTSPLGRLKFFRSVLTRELTPRPEIDMPPGALRRQPRPRDHAPPLRRPDEIERPSSSDPFDWSSLTDEDRETYKRTFGVYPEDDPKMYKETPCSPTH